MHYKACDKHINSAIMVDCSHGNSNKDFTKQAFGAESENTNYGIKSSQVKDFLEANNLKIGTLYEHIGFI